MMLPKQSVLSQRSLRTFFDEVKAEHEVGRGQGRMEADDWLRPSLKGITGTFAGARVLRDSLPERGYGSL